MASNNPNQQRHPLHPPPPPGVTGGGGGVAAGIGRSAPIRTVGLPTPAAPALPGGMSTPTLVKSKLALTTTPGRQQQQQRQQNQHLDNPPAVVAPFSPSSSSAAPPPPPPAGGAGAGAGGQVAYATRNPKGPLPPQRTRQHQHQTHQHRPQPPPPLLMQPPAPPPQQQQQYRSTGAAQHPHPPSDPIVLARQSPGVPGAAKSTTTTPVNNDNEPLTNEAHVVQLPPPTQTAFHPLDAAAAAGRGPTPEQRPTGGGGGRGGGGRQRHFKRPPTSSSATSYKQPPTSPRDQTAARSTPKPPSPSPATIAVVPPTAPATPSSPDEEVDAFLRGNCGAGADVCHFDLRPSPLPPGQSSLSRARTLASRRAWADVIRVTNDALLGKESGMHHCCYSELLAAAKGTGGGGLLAPDASTIASGKVLEDLRNETIELMSLRFASQLKLRRYADLGAEVASLGLMPHLPDQYPGDDDRHSNGGGGGERGHVRAVSGMSGMLHDGTLVPPSPGTPGTFGTDASIDVFSSSPVPLPSASEQQGSSGRRSPPYAWKEGSLHPDPSATDALPSWVPFGLRILAAHQLQYIEGSSKAVDVLYDLRDRAVRTEYWNTKGMEIWRPTIDNALVNAFVRKREWRLALRSLEDLMKGLEEGAEREATRRCDDEATTASEEERKQLKDLIAAAASVELLSRQLLILLQSGAIRAAEAVQDEARLRAAEVRSLVSSPPPGTRALARAIDEMALVRQAPHRLTVNEGLLLFARCEYADASKHFEDSLKQQRLDLIAESHATSSAGSDVPPPGCPTWKDLTSPTLGFDAEPSLAAECINNMSLCLLYSGDMRAAVQGLEGLIREDPCRYLTEGVAFNLCTLYELGFDGEECTRKKTLLQRVANRFYLHDVGVESFRLG